MFNIADYQTRLDTLAAELALSPDEWMPMVAPRYAAFLRMRANAEETSLAEILPTGNGTQQSITYIQNMQEQIAGYRALAIDLDNHIATLAEPAVKEAMMRLYEEASQTPLEIT